MQFSILMEFHCIISIEVDTPLSFIINNLNLIFGFVHQVKVFRWNVHLNIWLDQTTFNKLEIQYEVFHEIFLSHQKDLSKYLCSHFAFHLC